MNICKDIIKLFMVFSEKITDWIINLDAIDQAVTLQTIPNGGLLDPVAKNLIEVIIHFASGTNIGLIELTHTFWHHLSSADIDLARVSILKPELKDIPEVVKSQLLAQLNSELIPYYKAILEKTILSATDKSIQTMGLIDFDKDEVETFRDSSQEVFVACYYALRGQSVYVCEEKLVQVTQKETITTFHSGLEALVSLLENNQLTEEFMDNFAKALMSTLPDFALLESIFYAMNSFGDLLKRKESEEYFSQLFSRIQHFANIIANMSRIVSEKLIVHPFHSQFTRVVADIVKNTCGGLKNTSNIFINFDSCILIPLFKSISKLVERFSNKIVPLGEQPIIWCINFIMTSMSSFQNTLNSKL